MKVGGVDVEGWKFVIVRERWLKRYNSVEEATFVKLDLAGTLVFSSGRNVQVAGSGRHASFQ